MNSYYTIRINIVRIGTKTTPCTNSYDTICITIVWICLYECVQKLAKKIVSRLGFQPGTNIALAIVAVSAIHRPTSPVSGHFIRTIKKTIRKLRLYKFIRVAYSQPLIYLKNQIIYNKGQIIQKKLIIYIIRSKTKMSIIYNPSRKPQIIYIPTSIIYN